MALPIELWLIHPEAEMCDAFPTLRSHGRWRPRIATTSIHLTGWTGIWSLVVSDQFTMMESDRSAVRQDRTMCLTSFV